MNQSFEFYEEILKCCEYETRNQTVYGNVILFKMESPKGSKKLQFDSKGNENYFQ